MNPFYEGQTVICINDNFGAMLDRNGNVIDEKPNISMPKKDEILVVDKVFERWIGFEKYYNYQHRNDGSKTIEQMTMFEYEYFAPIEDGEYIEEKIEELMRVEELETV